MNLTPYQVVAPVLALIAILYAWNLALRQKKTLWEVGLWTLFWGMVAIIAIFPNVVSYLSIVTGIEDHESAVVVTFLGILFFVVFYLVIRLEELEQRHAKIIREIGLIEAGLTKFKSEKPNK